MATALKNLSDHDPEKVPSAQHFRFAVVVSDYHEDITYALRDGCIETLQQHGANDDNIAVTFVPGAYELPGGALAAIIKNDYDAVICLGCVIKGETQHDEYINHSVAQATQQLMMEYQLPVIFGLLTPNTHQQAKDRSGGKHGNKGTECAVAAIKMAALFKDSREH